jgi:peptidoglycan/xylan/chitin deacetylase (PgdA/CDA1 family)
MLGKLGQQGKKIIQGLRKKAIVLCYHRIAEVGVDPWDLVVTARNFEAQLQVLSNHFNVVGIPDLLNNFQDVVKRKTVCISFDDGYRDNFITARPLLKKYAIPATFFISSGYIDSGQLFWWDQLADLLLTSQQLPFGLSLRIGNEQYSFSFERNSSLSDQERNEICQWRPPQNPPNRRCDVFLKLWTLLRPLEVSEQKSLVQQLMEAIEPNSLPAAAERHPMTESELVEMGDDSLFTIGLHTENHAALGLHAPSFQEREVLQNRRHLESMTGRKADIISFPYGSYNGDSLELAEKLSLSGCFTSKRSLIFRQTNHYQLGRYPVKNWSGEEFKAKLDHWFSKV